MSQIAVLDRKCSGCGFCIKSCPFNAIDLSGGKAEMNAACRVCGICIKACPENAIIRLETRAKSVDKSKWKGILVFAEQSGERLHPVSLELIGKARELAAGMDWKVSAVLPGENMRCPAEELLHYGIDNVYVYDDKSLSYFRADAFAACVEDAIKIMRPSVVLFGATSLGRSLAPRLSTRFHTGLTADCTELQIRENTDLVQIRPAFGGNIMAQIVTSETRPQFATVRYKVMNAPERGKGSAGKIISRKLPKQADSSPVKLVSSRPVPKAANISEAEVLVVAGRGVEKKDDLAMIRELAGLLGGEYAVSRPLVEKGWETNLRQVGLSGRTVRPKLIITFGVSGAIQFTAAMNGSELIIAVNKDPDAPIFKTAHIGITGDLYQIVPELIAMIKTGSLKADSFVCAASQVTMEEGGEGLMPFNKVTAADISMFREIIGEKRVFCGDVISEDYDHDEMTEYGHFAPEAVLLAESADEISKILRYCGEHSIAVTPRGAGTGLCGGCAAVQGGIVLSAEKMDHVLEIDRCNMTATVEPGVLLMEFIKTLEGTGLFYPPDPGEKSATLGGNVMTNAGGMRAVRYGVTRDYVLGMQVVLASGEIIELGGKIAKNSSGYSLLDLMIGSEGTLGFVTRITLRLIPAPLENLTLLVPFDDPDKCIGAVPRILTCGCEPTAVEFMEREVIEASEEYLGKQFPDKQADAYLLLRLDGPSRAALEPAICGLTDLLLELGAKDVLMADTDERKQVIWDARGSFLEAIKGGTTSMDECDVVVPRDRMYAFVRKSLAIGKELGIRIRSFGHAGDGNLHIYACKDQLSDIEWKSKRGEIMRALYSEARALGGQVSGEHGIGHAKAGFLRDSLGNTQIELMRGIKKVFDPGGIMNPGKII